MISGISIIVPTHNEERYIFRSIKSINESMADSEIPYEIIAVDNLSNDSTQKILSVTLGEYQICKNQGNPSATRNQGAKTAKYNILCFIDGDCLITGGWASRVVEAFLDKKLGAFGGPALSPSDGNWVETGWAPTAVKPYLKRKSVLPGANFCVRKSIFDDLDGFDEKLTTAEDDDLSKRILGLGYDVISDSRHPVIHLGYPKTLLEIYKKQLWHASSQLKAHGILGDKMIVATIIWGLATILLPFFILNPLVGALSLSVFLFIPLLVAKYRTKRFQTPIVISFFKAYLISFFFLAGRAVGLVKEILKKADE